MISFPTFRGGLSVKKHGDYNRCFRTAQALHRLVQGRVDKERDKLAKIGNFIGFAGQLVPSSTGSK